MRLGSLGIFSCVLLLVASPKASAQNQSWARKAWIAKVARHLSGEKKNLTVSEVNELAKLTDAEIVDRFISDRLFAEAVARFHLSFLGHSPQFPSKAGEAFPQEILNKAPGAFSSAREVLRDGDVFKLFDLVQPLYMAPLAARPFSDRLKAPELAQLRRESYDKALGDLQVLLSDLEQAYPKMPENFCEKLTTFGKGHDYLRAYFPLAIVDRIDQSKNWTAPLRGACRFKDQQPEALRAQVKLLWQRSRLLFARLDRFEAIRYQTSDVASLESLELSDLEIDLKFFNYALGLQLLNNSTNLNRKRGAYVLKQFFCDDLAPVEIPEHDAKKLFRSLSLPDEPSCLACHARLDPMAGFFRTLGERFIEHRDRGDIRFDDGVVLKRADYEKNWLNTSNFHKNPWDVGYIRSEKDSGANSYGETLEDLSRLLKTAPEVRSCYVKRWYQSLVGVRQTVDRGFLQELKKEFEREKPEHSARALKKIVAKIVLGQAFREQNPVESRCYDRTGDARLPCEVSFVIEENCISCHANTSRQVDLSRVLSLPDGKLGFRHLDPRGQELPARESFRIILDRISTKDPNLRMPRRSELKPADRDLLRKWLEEQLR